MRFAEQQMENDENSSVTVLFSQERFIFSRFSRDANRFCLKRHATYVSQLLFRDPDTNCDF